MTAYLGNFANKWIDVHHPPALALTPKSDKALVTIAAGRESRRLLAINEEHMRAYAQRLGADFVVLDWPGDPRWKMSVKLSIGRALEHYQRIIYSDVDVLFRPQCIDLFASCLPHELGIVDELQHNRQHPTHGREAEYKAFRKALGFPDIPLPWMFNAGIMVIPQSHLSLFQPPEKIRAYHSAEQDLWNARLLSSGLPYRLLDRRANWQYWTDKEFLAAPEDAVLHWSGAGEDRGQSIRAWATRYPVRDVKPYEPGQPLNRAWAIDARHAIWLNSVLMSGRFRTVLEIGCHQGYSTRAILSAVLAGKVKSALLCELDVLPELQAVIASYDLGDRVQIRQQPSVEFLASGEPYDLAFVDGDHSKANVLAEAKMLLNAKPLAVFAHDTNAAIKYPDCDGPSYLKAEFQAAGYLCLEDCLVRSGELTDRGMMFAARDRKIYQIGLDAYRAINDVNL